MLTRARRALILAGATALLALGAVTPAAAQKQTVVIYTAIENEQIAEYKKAYEKKYPNDKVEILNKGTPAGMAYVREQPAGSRAAEHGAPDAERRSIRHLDAPATDGRG